MFKRLLLVVLLVAAFSTTAHASFARGKKAYDERNWKLAITHLRPLAEQGDARAMMVLGNMYRQGYGVRRDLREAFLLYRKAGVYYNAEGMIMTAAMYQQGQGTPRSNRRALQWYERAATVGNSVGALFTGLYYYRGVSAGGEETIERDLPAAYRWLRIAAAAQGEPKIRESAARLADRLSQEITPEERAAQDAAVAAFKPADPESLGAAPSIDPPAGDKAAPEAVLDDAPPPAETGATAPAANTPAEKE